jgi:hypothetical protein
VKHDRVIELRPGPARPRKAPLAVGDAWVLLGPGTEVTITALRPKPTNQKPGAQAVTLNDGRTIAEATLRSSYMRRREYTDVFLPNLRRKLRAMFPERAPSATVLPFRRER